MTPADLLIAVAVMLIWGVNFVAAKLGVMQLPPILLMSIRFTTVAVLLLPFARVPRAQLRRIAGLSVSLGCAHFSFMFSGLRGLDAAAVSVLSQAQVPFAALIAAVLYRERLGWARTVGMLIAFAGVAVMAGEPRFGADYRPIVFVLIAAFLWAAANIQIKQLGPVSSVDLNAYLALFAAPQLLIVSLTIESGHVQALATADWSKVVFAVFYMAVIVQIASYTLWYRLLRRYPINQIMPLTLLVPVFGALSGVILLDEPFGWRMIVGSAATLGGVALIILRGARKTTAPS